MISGIKRSVEKQRSAQIQTRPHLSRSTVIVHLGCVLVLAIAFYQLSIPIQFLIPFASQPSPAFLAGAEAN